MERKTDFLVITFQCNKGMQVLQSWHGLPGRATANHTNTALRPETSRTVHTIKVWCLFIMRTKSPLPRFSYKTESLCSVPFHVFQLWMNEVLFTHSCFWLAMRFQPYSPPVFIISQSWWPSCLITKILTEQRKHFSSISHNAGQMKALEMFYSSIVCHNVAFQQHFICPLSISTQSLY